jgi:D-tyrosyl-tRNA(Tyr) deacylase
VRAHVQRVSRARVTADGEVTGEIGKGALILLGVRRGDTRADAAELARKCAGLRFFPDSRGAMNLSLTEVSGGALVVSQFTLYGDCSGGRRPSFLEAAPGPDAEPLYGEFCDRLAGLGIPVARGRFGASMQIEMVGEGPVTLLLEAP